MKTRMQTKISQTNARRETHRAESTGQPKARLAALPELIPRGQGVLEQDAGRSSVKDPPNFFLSLFSLLV